MMIMTYRPLKLPTKAIKQEAVQQMKDIAKKKEEVTEKTNKQIKKKHL